MSLLSAHITCTRSHHSYAFRSFKCSQVTHPRSHQTRSFHRSHALGAFHAFISMPLPALSYFRYALFYYYAFFTFRRVFLHTTHSSFVVASNEAALKVKFLLPMLRRLSACKFALIRSLSSLVHLTKPFKALYSHPWSLRSLHTLVYTHVSPRSSAPGARCRALRAVPRQTPG